MTTMITRMLLYADGEGALPEGAPPPADPTPEPAPAGPGPEAVDTSRPAQESVSALVYGGHLASPIPDDRYWFVWEAARATGIHPNTLRSAVARGQLPFVTRLPKRTILLRESDVRRYQEGVGRRRSQAQTDRHARERDERERERRLASQLEGELQSMERQFSNARLALRRLYEMHGQPVPPTLAPPGGTGEEQQHAADDLRDRPDAAGAQ